ncbi:hypothetical protein KW505_07100 [Vibrio fluvialis]|nr:hypothetical protein [Vibrio fluvialis]EKO3445552.1 hypothetical protein [Vibrio fluvialis]ELG2961281.1 hypothetical protein [Vibrio fluvialis]ELK3676902.1 hypothetical protein [Vibrio fluvialis]MBY8179481.1 hypothetical protein [Vibrio fluvialis]
MCKKIIKKACDFLDKNLRWEQYRIFFNLIILRYLVLWFAIVPILGGLFSKIKNPITFIDSVGKQHELNLALPFSWQLLWLSSLFFVLSLFIYYIRCPNFVRKYHNFSYYKEYFHDYRWLVWEAEKLVKSIKNEQMDKFIDRLHEKKEIMISISEDEFNGINNENNAKVSVEKTCTSLTFSHKNKYFKLSLPRHESNEDNLMEQVGVFYEIYGRFSSSRHLSRFFILILLSFSGLLFAYVFCQHIFHGGEYFYEWLSN